MNILKHTPGSWKEEHSHSGETVFANGNVICFVYKYDDAKLIAVSPELLSALIKSTKYMEVQRHFMNYADDVETYENNIKLIEKTTGLKWKDIKDIKDNKM